MMNVRTVRFKLMLWIVVGFFVATPSHSHDHCDDQIRESGYCSVPIVAILANPKLYDGVNVAVAGYYRGGPEVSALFLTKDYGERLIIGGAIWVSKASYGDVESRSTTPVARETFDGLAADDRLLEIPAANENYVYVLGTFRAGPSGRFRAYYGSIENALLVKTNSPPR